MNNIEKSLHELDTYNIKTIQSLNNNVSNTIYKIALSSNITAAKIDMQFNKKTELSNLVILDKKPFNPHIVCEFRNSSAYNVLDTRQLGNKSDGLLPNSKGLLPNSKGLLPNRNVLGKYYLDIGFDLNIGLYPGMIYCKPCKGFVNFNHCTGIACNCGTGMQQLICKHGTIVGKKKLYCSTHSTVFDLNIPSTQSSNINVPCGCLHLQKFKQQNLKARYVNHEIIRGNERKTFFCEKSYEFEIDNYLNLYHKETGLYLMFNKTSFPLIGFHLKEKPFIPKRLNKLNFRFDQSFYNSIDQRADFLSSINELIPDDYDLILKKNFEIFRQLNNAKLKQPCVINAENNSLQTRLDQMTVKTEKIIRDQSIQNKLLNHANIKLNSTIENMKKEYKQDSNRELEDASSYQTTFDAISMSYESLKSDMNTNSMYLLKLKNINISLIDQLDNEMKVNTQLKTDNTHSHKLYMNIHKLYTDVENRLKLIESDNTNLKSNLLDKTNECIRIEQSLNYIEESVVP
jgi:hypothetical protein